MNYRLAAMNLSVTHVDQMVEFYRRVFAIEFTTEDIGEGTLYLGKFAGVDFCLVPATLTGITAATNRMQLDLHVDDIDSTVALTEQHGGRTNGRMAEDDEVRCIGIYDPDDNFIVIKQPKRKS